jgi:glutaredoxin
MPMTFRKVLPAERVSDRIQKTVSAFHPEAIERVEDAISRNKVVVVGMRGNYFVKKALKNLSAWNIPCAYVEFGSYFSQYNQRVTLKMWTGYSTFPMIFVNGVLIGGNSDMEAEKADGSLDSRLSI